jgi:tetratricopeptide (TPR) repeat protein
MSREEATPPHSGTIQPIPTRFLRGALLGVLFAVVALTSGCPSAPSRSYEITDEPVKASPQQRELRALKILRQAQTAVGNGDAKDAVALYRQALTLYEELDDFAAQAAIHNDLGLILRSAGALDRAAEVLAAGLALAKKGDEATVVAEARYNLGLVEYERGNAAEAERHLGGAIEDAVTLGNRELEGLGLNARGNLRRRANSLAPAIDDYTRAAAIWEEMSRSQFAAIAYMNIGYCEVLRGNGDAAAVAFEAAVTKLEGTTGADRDALVPHLETLSRTARTDPEKAREKVLRVLGRE